jgi:hypothetical protein
MTAAKAGLRANADLSTKSVSSVGLRG